MTGCHIKQRIEDIGRRISDFTLLCKVGSALHIHRHAQYLFNATQRAQRLLQNRDAAQHANLRRKLGLRQRSFLPDAAGHDNGTVDAGNHAAQVKLAVVLHSHCIIGAAAYFVLKGEVEFLQFLGKQGISGWVGHVSLSIDFAAKGLQHDLEIKDKLGTLKDPISDNSTEPMREPRAPSPFPFDFTGLNLTPGRGLAEQLYQLLRERIRSGQLDAHVKLPTTREFANALQISRNTVIRAYDQLYAEGYISGRVGDGTYVAEPAARLPKAQASADSVAAPTLSALAQRIVSRGAPAVANGPPRAFRMGVPPLDQFPGNIWARLQANFWRRTAQARIGYGDPAGDPQLRDMIAGYLRHARGLACDPAQIIITAGTQQAIFLCTQLLLDPGAQVAIENPNYPRAAGAFALAGAQLQGVAVDEEGLITAQLADLQQARMVYVTPAHQYPCGATLSLTRRLALLDWAEKHQGFVLEDDYDGEYRYSGTPLALLASLDRHGRVIYVGTFSKITFPGLRLGYIVAPPSLVLPLTLLRSQYDRHSSAADQAVMAEFIAQGHFQRHVRKMRRTCRTRRDALLNEWQRLRPSGYTLPETPAGLHAILRVPTQGDERRLISKAAAVGVEIDPLARFWLPGTRPQTDPGGLVLGFGGVDEKAITAAVGTLQKAWATP